MSCGMLNFTTQQIFSQIMLEWIIETIQYFQERQDIFLVIRVHPAEISGHLASRQLVSDVIEKNFGKNLENVIVIGPDELENSYSLALISDSVIIYGSKIGVELSAMGIPVIIAGEAWLRNKRIGIDVKTKHNYFAKLDSIPLGKRLTNKKTQRAKKYAYHFFYRRMIPMMNIEPTGGVPKYKVIVNSAEQLTPGNCRGLDVVCNGILTGSEFIYDE